MNIIGDLKGRMVRMHTAEIFVILLAGILFTYTYWVDPTRPGALFNLGYYEQWYDQSQYYNMATSIIHGNLGRFTYPLGYPLFGSVGYIVHPQDPFVLIDLLSFLIFSILTYKICLKFFSEQISILATLLNCMSSVDMFSTPWTSTITATSFIYIVYIAILQRYDIKSNILAGICLGLTFAARIGDIIPVSAVYGIYVIQYIRKNRVIYRPFIVASAMAVLIIAATVIINHHFSGLWLGPYSISAMNPDYYSIKNLPYRLFGYFVNPLTFEGETHIASIPLLKHNFMFILAPLGMIELLFSKNKPKRSAGLVFLVGFLGWSILYFPFVAISGYYLKFVGFHYFKMLFPVMTIASFEFLLTIGEGNKLNYNPLKKFGIYLVLLCVSLGGMMQLNFSPIGLRDAIVTASENQEKAKLAIDGDNQTRWDTGKSQSGGMNFVIDLKSVYFVNHIVMDNRMVPQGNPKEIDIYSSMDGKIWDHFDFVTINPYYLEGKEYFFPARDTRFLNLTLKQGAQEWWTIHELKVFGR
jgi:hypothetical protein